MRKLKQRISPYAAQVFGGFLMGGANAIPGISGGTVALILGIYERLITAVSRFDLTLVGHLRNGRWKEAAEHIDFRFLLTLGFGVVIGIVATARLLGILMADERTRALTYAAFLGMIFASGILVVRMIKVRSARDAVVSFVLGLLGAAGAFWLSTLGDQDAAAADPTYLYLFICGALAMSATILPGISGSMVFLIMGVYVFLFKQVPDQLLAGEKIGPSLLSFAAVGFGCLLSLFLFSKILRWLLAHYHSGTMAVLCGCMFGSLPELWPFQEQINSKQFRPVLPDAVDLFFLAVIGVALASMLGVFALHRISNGRSTPQPPTNNVGTACEKVAP